MGLFDTFRGTLYALPPNIYGQSQTQTDDGLPPTPDEAAYLHAQQLERSQYQEAAPPEIPEVIERDGIQLGTPRTRGEVVDFLRWAEQNKVTEPYHPDQHYDYYSAYKAGVNRNETGHFPDTFKLPGHETFSTGSKYYKPGMKAGTWDSAGNFVPYSESFGTQVALAIPRAGQGLIQSVLTGVPDIVGRSMQYLGVAPQTGQRMEDWAKRTEEEMVSPVDRESAWYQGAKMIGPALLGTPAGVLKSAVAVGSKLGKVAGVLQHAIPMTAFGASTAHDVKERAETAGVDPGAAPLATGLVMSAGFGLANKYLLKMLGPLMAKAPTAQSLQEGSKKLTALSSAGMTPTKAMIQESARIPTAQQILQSYVSGYLPANLGAIAGTTFLNAEIEKAQGIRPDADPLGEALETLPSGIAMNLIMGPASSAAAYIKGKKTLEQLHKDFGEFATKAKEAQKIQEHMEATKDIQGREVYKDITGDLRTEQIGYSAMEKQVLDNMAATEQTRGQNAEPVLGAFADNTKVGDKLVDKNNIEHIVTEITPDGKIVAHTEENATVGKMVNDIIASLPVELRERALQAYSRISSEVEYARRNGRDVPIANLANMISTKAPELPSDVVNELVKLADSQIYRKAKTSKGNIYSAQEQAAIKKLVGKDIAFTGGELQHTEPRPRAQVKYKAMTAHDLKGKNIKDRAQLINEIQKFQLKGGSVSGMLNLIKTPERASELITRLSGAKKTREELKLEKKKPSLQDTIIERTADLIRINRATKHKIEETGGEVLDRKEYEAAVGETEAQLKPELERLQEKHGKRGIVYRIVPAEEGSEFKFQIARVNKEYAIKLDTAKSNEATIKKAALHDIVIALRASETGKKLSDAQLNTIAIDLYNRAEEQARKVPDIIEKAYPFGLPLDPKAEPGFALAKHAQDYAMTDPAKKKLLKDIARDWFYRFIKNKKRFEHTKKLEWYKKYVEDIKNPQSQHIIMMGVLDPAILRDFIAGKDIIKMVETLDERIEIRGEKIKEEKRVSNKTLRDATDAVNALLLIKATKPEEATEIQPTSIQQLITLAKEHGITDEQVRAILKTTSTGEAKFDEGGEVTGKTKPSAKKREPKDKQKAYESSLRNKLTFQLEKANLIKAGTKMKGTTPEELVLEAKEKGLSKDIVDKKISEAKIKAGLEQAEEKEKSKKEKPEKKATVTETADTGKKLKKKTRDVLNRKGQPIEKVGKKEKVIDEESITEEGEVAGKDKVKFTWHKTNHKIDTKNKTEEEVIATAKEAAKAVAPKGKWTKFGFIVAHDFKDGQIKFLAEKPKMNEIGEITFELDLGRNKIDNADKYRLHAEKYVSTMFHPGEEYGPYGKLLSVKVDKLGNPVLRFKPKEVALRGKKKAGEKEAKGTTPTREGKGKSKGKAEAKGEEKKVSPPQKQPSRMPQDQRSSKEIGKPSSDIVTQGSKFAGEKEFTFIVKSDGTVLIDGKIAGKVTGATPAEVALKGNEFATKFVIDYKLKGEKRSEDKTPPPPITNIKQEHEALIAKRDALMEKLDAMFEEDPGTRDADAFDKQVEKLESQINTIDKQIDQLGKKKDKAQPVVENNDVTKKITAALIRNGIPTDQVDAFLAAHPDIKDLSFAIEKPSKDMIDNLVKLTAQTWLKRKTATTKAADKEVLLSKEPTPETAESAAVRLIKLTLGFVDDKGHVRASLTKKEKTKLDKEVERLRGMTPHQATTWIKKNSEILAKENIRLDEIGDVMVEESIQNADASDIFGRINRFDIFSSKGKKDMLDGLTEFDPDATPEETKIQKSLVVTRVGRTIQNLNPSMKYKEWIYRLKEYFEDKWGLVKSFAKDIWERITAIPNPTMKLVGLMEPIQHSKMFDGMSGREMFQSIISKVLRTDPWGHWHLNNIKVNNRYEKAALLHLVERLTIRTDTRAKWEANALFDLAISVIRNQKDRNGKLIFPEITNSEVKAIRNYLDMQSIMYHKTMESGIAKKLHEEIKSQLTGNESTRKVRADEIVAKMLSPEMLSDKIYDSLVDIMRDAGETRFELSDNWSIHAYKKGAPRLYRKVTDTVRHALKLKGEPKPAGKNPNDQTVYVYPNGVRVVRTVHGEFIFDNWKGYQDNINTYRKLDILDNTKLGYKINSLIKETDGKFKSIIDTLTATPKDATPNLTDAYLRERLPGVDISRNEDGSRTITLDNGFKFKLTQDNKTIESTGTRVGSWTVGDFTNSIMDVARDVENDVAIKAFDHELYHLAVDTMLTRAQQKALIELHKLPTDKSDYDAWERGAERFANDVEYRRSHPALSLLKDGLVKVGHAVMSAFGYNMEPARYREALYRSLASGRLFTEPVQLNSLQFEPHELRSVVIKGKVYDPNWQAKESWLADIKNPVQYSILKAATEREKEHQFLHEPLVYQKIKDLLKSFKHRDFYNIKGKVVSRLEHWLSNPAFLSMARMYETDAQGNRVLKPKYKPWHDMVDRIHNWAAMKAQDIHIYKYEKTHTFQTMKPHEAVMFDPLCEWSNVNKRYLTEQELRNPTFMKQVYKDFNPEIKTGVLPEATVKGYLEISNYLKTEALPQLKRIAEESILKPYRIQGVLTAGEYGQLATLYRDLMNNKPPSAAVLAALKTTNPNVVTSYKNLETSLVKLRQLRNKMQYGLEGFFPMRRNQGPYYVAVIRYENNPNYNPNRAGSKQQTRTIIQTYSAPNAGACKRIQDYISKQVAADPAFARTATTRFEVIGDRSHKLEDSSFFLVGDINTQAIVDQALSSLVANQSVSVADAAKLSNQILSSIADTMKSRGAQQSSIARTFIKWEQSPLIKGYIRDDMRKVINGYMAGLIGLKHKLNVSIEGAKIIHDIPENAPQMKEDLSEYLKDNLRNLDQYDRMVGQAKSLAFNMYLLGKMSFSVMQLTQNFVTGMPVLAAEMRDLGHKKGLLGAEKLYTKSMFDIAKNGVKDQNEIRMLEKMEKLGVTLPQLSEDLGIEAAAFGDSVKLRILKALAWPVAATETFNRKAASLAYYRMIKAAEPMLSEPQIYEKISHYIDKTHYWMGRGNNPAFARGASGLGKAGSLGYTFGRFWHNYALSMAYGFQHYGAKGGGLMMARSLAWLAALGGVPALPFVDELLDMYERTTGDPIRKRVKRSIKSNFGEPAKHMYEAGMFNFVLGADMSAAIRPLRLPFMGNAAESLLGVYYGLGSKLANSYDALTVGDYARATMYITPAFVENVGKAAITYKRGYRTATNQPVLDEQGKPLMITPSEAARMALGFKPYRPSEVQEERRIYQNVKYAWLKKRQDLNERARLARTQSEIQTVENLITKYNLSIPKELQGIIPKATFPKDKPDKKWLEYSEEYK